MEEQVIAMFTGIHKVSLTADGWTSPFQDDFLGVTAHWIDGNWTQKELVIGFEPLRGAHTGENLAEALVNVLERFHLGEKLQSITTDNASNMAKMVRDLVKHPKAVEWYVWYGAKLSQCYDRRWRFFGASAEYALDRNETWYMCSVMYCQHRYQVSL